MFKQQKYDANRAKVDSLVQQYGALQLARGVDRDYLNQRLSYLIDNINNSSNQDFGSNGFTSTVTNYIGEALDSNVMTAIQETAKIQKYQQEVEKIKEKNPELYNPLNEAYGLAPAQQYLESDEVGAKIKGSLIYTPYKNIEGEINKILMDIQMKAKDGKIQIPDNQGRIQEVTINGKSAQELRDIALGLMGSQYDNQFKINVWGNTGGFKNLDAHMASAVAGYETNISEKTKHLAELKAKMSGPLSETEKNAMSDKVKAAENDLLQTTQMRDMLKSGDPINSLVFLEKQKVAGRSGAALGLLQTSSVEYKVDEYIFKTLDHAMAVERLNFDKGVQDFNQKYKLQELELAKAKLAIDAQKAEGSGSDSGPNKGTKGASNDGIIFEDVDVTGLPDQQESYKDRWKAAISNDYNALNAHNMQVMDKVVRIAKGLDEASPAQKQDAINLITQFRANGGNLNTQSAKQAQNFTRMLSRADAYSSLTYLPIGGTRAINVKQQYQDLQNSYNRQYLGYSKARAAAQAEERASGRNGAYGDNLQFQEAAKRFAPFNMMKTASLIVDSKNKANVNRLLSSSEELRNAEQVPILVEDTPLKVRDLQNGKYQITFQSKSKDASKDAVYQNNTVTVSYAQANRLFPSLTAFQQPAPKYNIQTMGTKPLISTNVNFANPGSSNFENLSQDISKYSTSPIDTQLVDRTSAKIVMSQVVGLQGQKPDVKAKLNSIIDAALDPRVVNKYKTGVSYNYSAASDNGTGYMSIYNRDGQKVASLNLGEQQSMDNLVKMNQWAPQVNYSKVVIGELTKMMQVYNQTGQLQLTPELQKIIHG